MEATTPLVCSKVTPFGPSTSSQRLSSFPSLRHFNKRIACTRKLSLNNNSKPIKNSPLSIAPNFGNPLRFQSLFTSLPTWDSGITRPVKCSYSNSTSPESDLQNPVLKDLKDLNFESLRLKLLQLTPFDVCKWLLVFSVVIAASRWTLNVLFSPFFWMYFSWTWLFWPWMVAIGLAMYGVYALRKHVNGEASLFEQLGIVISAITWLTLVPPAHFNGFLEGWPFVFFFVYHYFFFLNVSVRKRLYGDYYLREHDAKWDVGLPNWQKLVFFVGVMVGHWLAGLEGTELHLVPGGWNNVPIWILIMMTVFMQYHSTLYLAKYSEKVVVPTAVVQFGPYRFVRHPIYTSTILLFVTYFVALRSPLSALFVIAVCLLYYGEKAKLEETLMLETFGDRYSEYMSKVKYKLIPFVY